MSMRVSQGRYGKAEILNRQVKLSTPYRPSEARPRAVTLETVMVPKLSYALGKRCLFRKTASAPEAHRREEFVIGNLCYFSTVFINANTMNKGGFVYIITNKTFTVLYTGVTSNLQARTQQHKQKYYPNSFSARYNCCILVYYRFFPTIVEAIAEEKRIKGGNRNQKIRLISEMNSEWKDLWEDIKDW